MIFGIILLAIGIPMLLNHRDKSNKEWGLAVKEYRRENCNRHNWSYHPVSNKLMCINCEFTP